MGLLRKSHIDLFSGIGGFALASKWAGFETIQFVENDKYCCKVLKKNFPEIPIHDDIKTFKATDFRGCGLITGGVPCQPVSQAGKRRGSEDDRWLWPQMYRVILESRPTYVLIENVAGLITLGLDDVLADLEKADYSFQTFNIPAVAVDARHRRQRIWILAYTDSKREIGNKSEYREGCGFESRSEDVVNSNSIRCSRYKEPSETSSRGRSETPTSTASEDVAYTDKFILQRRKTARNDLNNRKKSINKFVSRCNSNHKPSGTRQTGWLTEPDVGRVAHGVRRRVDRLRGLGNAIVPQVAYEIIRCLK